MKKIVVSLLIVLILIFTLSTNIFAAGSFSANLKPSSTKVNKGEEVTVTFKISGINVEGGIAAIKSTLRFDSDVLSLSKDDVKGLNDWTASYTEESKKLTFDRVNVVTSDSEVATLKFKVNDSTSATTASIQLVQITAGNADIDEEVKISNITTNISISKSGGTTTPTTSPSSSPSNSPSSSPSTVPTISPSSSPSTVPTNSPINNNNNTSNKTIIPTSNNGNVTTTANNQTGIPNAGSNDNYVLPLIGIIAVLGVISFINYKRIDNK